MHAAGNDAKDIDIEPNYPTSKYSFQELPLDHFLTIGASTKDKEELVASFSNYGQTGVDIFAPGLEIYNTVPQSAYQNLQGTSMAAPMVTGVAAMLKSYFPTLSMKEIKDVMLTTVVKYTVDEFATKSVTGGVVNVYNGTSAQLKLSLRITLMQRRRISYFLELRLVNVGVNQSFKLFANPILRKEKRGILNLPIGNGISRKTRKQLGLMRIWIRG